MAVTREMDEGGAESRDKKEKSPTGLKAGCESLEDAAQLVGCSPNVHGDTDSLATQKAGTAVQLPKLAG